MLLLVAQLCFVGEPAQHLPPNTILSFQLVNPHPQDLDIDRLRVEIERLRIVPPLHKQLWGQILGHRNDVVYLSRLLQ